MKKTEEKTNHEIINVIDEFDYSTQQESYNKRFIAWRKNKDNPYAFNFKLNKKETIFVDGQGFVDQSAADAETDTLTKILHIIGIAALSVFVIQNIFDKLLVQVLDALGFDIHNAFFNSTIYGGKTEIVVVLIVITTLKYLVPLLILHFNFRMSPALAMPVSLRDPLALIAAIGAALVASVITGIPAAYSNETEGIYNFFRSYDADVSVWDQNQFLVYIIFDVVIVSIFMEILFHGEMYNALRQFGDIYALTITSVMSGLLSQSYRNVVVTTLISAVAAIGILRSGTIFTGIAVRITYKMYMMGLAIMQTGSSDSIFLRRSIFMICIFLAGTIILTIVCLYSGKRQKTFARYNAHVSFTKKLSLTLKVFPLSIVIAISLIAIIISIFV